MIIPIPLEYLPKVWPEARACFDNFFEGHGFKTVDDILDDILEGRSTLLVWKEEMDTKPLYFTAHKVDFPSGQTGIQVTNFGSDGLDISNYKGYADWQQTVTRDIEKLAKKLGFDIMLVAARPATVKALPDYTKQTTIIFKRL
jgi:hypothetical protein